MTNVVGAGPVAACQPSRRAPHSSGAGGGPALEASPAMRQWVTVLAPWERGQPTKAGSYDETVALDDSRLPGLGLLLSRQVAHQQRRLRLKEGADAPLWDFTAKQLLDAWHEAVGRLSLGSTLECMYQLRHGGASRDQLLHLRSTAQIQRRGRWAAVSSLRTYNKPGRLQQLLAQTPGPLLRYAELVRKNFVRYMHDGCPAPPLLRAGPSLASTGAKAQLPRR